MFLAACSKDKRPTITIVKPQNGQIFNAPATIEIIADIYDSDAVQSEYLIVTKNLPPYDTIINLKENKVSPGSYHIYKTFTSQANTQYKIMISGRGHGNWTSDSVFIMSQ